MARTEPKKAQPKKKRARRPKGTGSLFQRKQDGLWIGRYVYEDEHGKEQRAQVSSKDKVLAGNRLRDLITEIHSGTYAPSTNMTIENWLKYWLDDICKPHVAPSSYKTYKRIINNQILGEADRQINSTMKMPPRTNVIRGNLAYVREKWSASTTILTHFVWDKSMRDAKEDKLIKFNPVESIRRPEASDSEGTALTSDQARKVLLAAQKDGDPMATRWAAALLLGARQGELLGLEWDRLDLDAGVADIAWQLQSLAFKEGAGVEDEDRFDAPPDYEVRPLIRKYALVRPKGGKSKRRLVPLPKPLIEVLKEYKKITPTNTFGLVWVSPSGQPIHHDDDLQNWYAALKRAKVPKVRLHDARHTTATLLMDMGVEETVRMKILGQSSKAVHRVYTHADLDMQRKALGNLDGLMALNGSGDGPDEGKDTAEEGSAAPAKRPRKAAQSKSGKSR